MSVTDALTGVIFGSSLYAAGVYAPTVIIEQLRWTNLHMLQTFMTGSAFGALVLRIADASGHLPNPVRTSRELGYFPYDGNVVGGAMIGAGMALTGACPGTVFVQTAAGVSSGKFILAGSILGGLLYSTQLSKWVRSSSARPVTVQKSFGLSDNFVIAAWEAICLLVIVACSILDPAKGRTNDSVVDPLTGGVLVGLSQAAMVILARRTLGTSSSFEDVGRWVGEKVKGKKGSLPATPNVLFVTGMAAGSLLVSRFFPPSTDKISTEVSPLKAVLGGVTMAIGARVAAGCTSGHGISGMATFSWSSFLTVAAMFGTGTAVALARG